MTEPCRVSFKETLHGSVIYPYVNAFTNMFNSVDFHIRNSCKHINISMLLIRTFLSQNTCLIKTALLYVFMKRQHVNSLIITYSIDGSTEKEKALVDMMLNQAYDLRMGVVMLCYSKDYVRTFSRFSTTSTNTLSYCRANEE